MHEAQAFMSGTRLRSRSHLRGAGQEAVEHGCGRSLLHPAQGLLGRVGRPGAALGRHHAPVSNGPLMEEEKRAWVWRRRTHLCATAACEIPSQLACLQERWRAWLWAKSSPHGTDASYRACGKPTHPLSSSPGTQEGYDVVEPRTAMKGSRLLTWRSWRASPWTSGIALFGDMGPA